VRKTEEQEKGGRRESDAMSIIPVFKRSTERAQHREIRRIAREITQMTTE
jgi:hypothetical protein